MNVPCHVTAAMLFLAAGLFAQTDFYPLGDVKPGTHGTGRTVFSGDRVEEFGHLERLPNFAQIAASRFESTFVPRALPTEQASQVRP